MLFNKYLSRERIAEDARSEMSAVDARAQKVAEGRHFTFERPLPADSLLRITEDFSPIYEMAFRAGIDGQQSRATLRTIERIHRTKMIEMANWTEAMRRAEAEKHRALKRIQDDVEVDQLRAQLKVMKARMDDKSKELSDNAHFLQQVAALRTNYEKERGKQHDMLESPPRVREDDAPQSGRQSTGKKQKLYNALHYSALYDGGEDAGGRCTQHGQVRCPHCGGDPSSSPANHAGGGGGATTPTPLKVHERYFHQRPAPSLNFSPAKSQLNPLKSVPPGTTGSSQQPLDVRLLPDDVRSARSTGGDTQQAPQGSSTGSNASSTPFGMARKKV